MGGRKEIRRGVAATTASSREADTCRSTRRTPSHGDSPDLVLPAANHSTTTGHPTSSVRTIPTQAIQDARKALFLADSLPRSVTGRLHEHTSSLDPSAMHVRSRDLPISNNADDLPAALIFDGQISIQGLHRNGLWYTNSAV